MYKTATLVMMLLLDIYTVSQSTICVGAEGYTTDPINLVCYNESSTQLAANDGHDCYCDQPVNTKYQQHCNILVNFNITSSICERSTSASSILLLCSAQSTSPTTSHHILHCPYYFYGIITIAVLGFTNIILVILVVLCSIALCFAKQRETARHRLCCHTTEIEMLKVVDNPTYVESNDQDQETCNGEQSQAELSSQYSTLGPTYDTIRSENLCVLMLPDASSRKKTKRPQRHTEPAKYTRHTYGVVSADDHDYSHLVQR